MKVREKNSPLNIYEVYDIKYDKAGYPHFLIYKNKQWFIVSAKYFVPASEPTLCGHWKPNGMHMNGVVGNWRCTACGGVSLKDSAYCPNCGVKMDGVE